MARCIVVGAGLAGAAVAWHLAQRGYGADLLVVERETAPGTHASAQNAAMIRSLVFEAEIAPFAIAGTRFWNAMPDVLRRPASFRRVGSLLLATEAETVSRLHVAAGAANAAGLAADVLGRAEVLDRLPVLEETPFVAAAWSACDGVADPAALVDAYLEGVRRRGGRVAYGSNVDRVIVESERARGVRLAGGETIAAHCVVVAPGAWFAQLATQSGFDDGGLVPHRRHLFTGSACALLERDAPFVWHLDAGAYVRAEAGGVLFSACDEAVVPPDRPRVAAGAIEHAAHTMGRVFPFASEVPITRAWAGLRTHGPTGRFRLGADPQIAGLFHAAGLGGHGVTCCDPVGMRVATTVAAGL